MSEQQREVVSNVPVKEDTDTRRISKEMVKWYIETLEIQLGTRGRFIWDERQEGIAERIASSGVTMQQWRREIMKSILWHKKEELRPPESLAFYTNAFKHSKLRVTDANKILTKATNKSRMP